MKKNLLFIITVCFLAHSSEVRRSEAAPGFVPVEIHKNTGLSVRSLKVDAKKDIPELFEQKYSLSETAETDSVITEVNGFRLQVFMTEDLNEAKIKESLYIENFGEENVILIFERPFYRIRVGKFRNRQEAVEFQESLSQRGIYRTIIVPDMVKVMMPVVK